MNRPWAYPVTSLIYSIREAYRQWSNWAASDAQSSPYASSIGEQEFRVGARAVYVQSRHFFSDL